jgi:hypothetical protein
MPCVPGLLPDGGAAGLVRLLDKEYAVMGFWIFSGIGWLVIILLIWFGIWMDSN